MAPLLNEGRSDGIFLSELRTLCAPVDRIRWAPIMEFTAADIFQHSPFGDILNSLKSLSLSGETWPDYGQQGWDADDEEMQTSPTTHFVAAVGNLTDMLD